MRREVSNPSFVLIEIFSDHTAEERFGNLFERAHRFHGHRRMCKTGGGYLSFRYG